MSTDTAPDDYTFMLREALVARIDRLGTFRTEAVKNAFLAVPRHLFLPEVDLATAYAPKPVVTKRRSDGTALSSASSPNIVATMLEQLQVAPGQRVLEIGTATGVNAALLAELVGPDGHVVTIELDEDLAVLARTHLAAAEYNQVVVLCGDGAFGDPSSTLFDRIIVTASTSTIPGAWWDQLASGGRLVVPLRLHGSGLTRSLAFTRTADDYMVSTNAAVCGFVPLRGSAETDETHVRLGTNAILKVDADDHPDRDALAKALTHPARQQWTGIQVRHDEPAAHLDLWLATIDSDLSFGKLSIDHSAHGLNLAGPAIRWSGATLYNGGTLAYLTTRPVDDSCDELGVTTVGPTGYGLSEQVEAMLYQWNRDRPSQPVIYAHRTRGKPDPSTYTAPLDTRLSISW